ncbi:acetylxylan esterase [Opitutales bacterium]|nr:acetylxylan esterase [Opitutales bacterium]
MEIKSLPQKLSVFLFLNLPLLGSPELREEILKLGELTTAPSFHPFSQTNKNENPRAILMESLPWEGKETRAYAWLGLPKVSKNEKVPGVVLVHGGGGTAFKNWVQEWNDRGFAAISIAVEGQIDKKVKNEKSKKMAWGKHQWAGPHRIGIFADTHKPLRDQWMYHAVSQTILANSLLRSLPQVDESKVGLMGTSWGGIISSIVMGIDQRFAFVIPVYGCGFLNEAGNHYKPALANNSGYLNAWEAGHRFNRARMPVLWFSWPEDKHFPMEILRKSYQATAGPNMVSLVPQMGHGHGPAWSRQESYAFAKRVLKSGKIWCRRLDSALLDGQAYARFQSDEVLEKAELVHTTDLGFTGKRIWTRTPIRLQKKADAWLADWPLPDGTTAWFINVESSGLVVSSDYHDG